MSTVLPGYADRVGPKMAFDKVAELIKAPSSKDTDEDLKIIVESLNASYPACSETAKAVEEVKKSRPELAAQLFSSPATP